MTRLATRLLDAALDRSVVLGYSKVGSGLRRRWWPADPEPGSMTGRRVLVTGATSGLGEAMTGAFARLGATVHVLGRNPDKVRASVAALRHDHPGSVVVEEVCDVGDLRAVRDWCDGFTDRVTELHGLVHNAGVMPPERTETAQQHEQALAVHVLGPHLLTERLMPVLGAAEGGATVVLMSSGGMYSAGLRSTPETIEHRDGTYSGIRAYARTKRMQVVLADAWSRRLRREGPADVRVESMHPGWAATPGVTDSLPGFGKVMGPLLRDAGDGADTAVWLVATRPPSDGDHHFWQDRARRPTTVGWQRPDDVDEVARFLEYVSSATGTSADW